MLQTRLEQNHMVRALVDLDVLVINSLPFREHYYRKV